MDMAVLRGNINNACSQNRMTKGADNGGGEGTVMYRKETPMELDQKAEGYTDQCTGRLPPYSLHCNY